MGCVSALVTTAGADIRMTKQQHGGPLFAVLCFSVVSPLDIQHDARNLADMLGYEGEHRRQMMHRVEIGERSLREPQRRLIEAYLHGYRPSDWPR